MKVSQSMGLGCMGGSLYLVAIAAMEDSAKQIN